MTDRSAPPEEDPLFAEILDIAASLDRKDLEPDLSDPALVELVDRAVAPYARIFSADGLARARKEATFALATHPDIGPVLDRVRSKLAQQGSGVRATRSAEDLAELAQRRGRKAGGR
jgi:hypothetical protein